MNFLKFKGKKGTNLKSEELDLPPLPPPLKGPEAKLGPIEQGPPLDEELPGPEKMTGKEPLLPESPEMPPPEFPEAPPLPEALEVGEAPIEEEKPETNFMEPFEMPSEKPERKLEKGPIYIKIDKYRAVLNEINKIKADFEKSKSILSSMVEIKASEDKELESWKYGLEDIRKKLSFIDNSIFKGG